MADKPKLSLIIDSLDLQADAIQVVDGVLPVPAVIARNMVYDYAGLKVLKPFDELEAAARFADGIPITREHPDAGIVTDRAEILGFLKNPIAENDELKGILEISDRDLIADVQSGKIKEVSIGFFCNLDHTTGTLDSTTYDAVQRGIFLNHVAAVENGRCSIEDGCGFNMDSKEPDELKAVTDKLDTMQAQIDTVTADRDSLKESLETIITTEKDAIIAELTAMQDAKTKEDLEKLSLDSLKKEIEMVKELQTDRLSFKGTQPARSAVDEAYAKVGR